LRGARNTVHTDQMFGDEITLEDAIWKAKTQKGETHGMLWRHRQNCTTP